MAGQNRKKRRRNQGMDQPLHSFRFVVAATLAFVSLIGGFVLASAVTKDDDATQTSSGIFQSIDDIPRSVVKSLDVVMVLGGGAPKSVDEPPAYVKKRCDDAAEVVKAQAELQGGGRGKRTERTTAVGNDDVAPSDARAQLPILCLSAGTALVPQAMSSGGLPIWEATACAGYLRRNHGLSKNVYVETTSYDTIGNAYFARTTHSDVAGWRNVLVITNEFHIRRTKAIFDWIFVRCNNHAKERKDKYRMHYLSTPDSGLSTEALKARKEKEYKSERNVREILVPKYRTLKAVWEFLNESHSFYTASKLVDMAKGKGGPIASEEVRKSYGGA